MYNKDIVELCNKSSKTTGLTMNNLKVISEILDTKSKAKTREGLCEAIIKKVYTNRLNGKPDFYNENWGFDKYACKKKKIHHLLYLNHHLLHLLHLRPKNYQSHYKNQNQMIKQMRTTKVLVGMMSCLN